MPSEFWLTFGSLVAFVVVSTCLLAVNMYLTVRIVRATQKDGKADDKEDDKEEEMRRSAVIGSLLVSGATFLMTVFAVVWGLALYRGLAATQAAPSLGKLSTHIVPLFKGLGLYATGLKSLALLTVAVGSLDSVLFFMDRVPKEAPISDAVSLILQCIVYWVLVGRTNRALELAGLGTKL